MKYRIKEKNGIFYVQYKKCLCSNWYTKQERSSDSMGYIDKMHFNIETAKETLSKLVTQHQNKKSKTKYHYL